MKYYLPINLFSHKFKILRFIKFPIEFGMKPVNPLRCKSNSIKLINDDMDSGISPIKLIYEFDFLEIQLTNTN